MVSGDDVLEGDLVTSDSRREHVSLLSGRHPRDRLHVP
jgi:hypothetical protein